MSCCDAIIVDGANYLQRLRYLLLPMLAPLFAIIIFWRFVTLVEDYGLIGLLTGGGPGTSTTTATSVPLQPADGGRQCGRGVGCRRPHCPHDDRCRDGPGARSLCSTRRRYERGALGCC